MATKNSKSNIKEKDNSLKDMKMMDSLFNKNKDESIFLHVPDYVKEWASYPELKKLKITEKEAVFYYSDLCQYNKEHQRPCQKNEECYYGGYHVNFNRDDEGFLRVYNFECPFKKDYDTRYNYLSNYLIENELVSSHQFDIEDVENAQIEKIDNLDEKQLRLSKDITTCFYKLFKFIKTKKELRMGIWYSGPMNIGKTYNAISLCNSLAKLNYSVIYIDNFEMGSKFSSFDANDANKWIKLFKDVDILIVDNFGMESTKFAWYYGNVLPNILEARAVKNKMTGFISNYTRNQLSDILKTTTKLDSIVVDRLFNKINNLVGTRVKEIKK